MFNNYFQYLVLREKVCKCCCVVDIFIDLMLLSEVVISLETSDNQTCGPLCWEHHNSGINIKTTTAALSL